MCLCCCISTRLLHIAGRRDDYIPQVPSVAADGNKTVTSVGVILSSSLIVSLCGGREGVQLVKVSEGVNMLCINTSLQCN